jgi:chromosome segregation ATPase
MSATNDTNSVTQMSNQQQPFPPPITTETLQYRLDTGNIGKQGGQRSSLTRCAQKFGTLQFHLLTSNPDAEVIESSKGDLVRELELFELEMSKLILWQQQLERQVRVNKDEQQKREQELASLSQQVGQSSRQARMALDTQRCFAEYEALAKLINDSHPTSTDELQHQIDEMKAEVATVEAETNAKNKVLKVREAQYQLLIQYMMDLKRSVDDDAIGEASGKPAPMELEDNLYGDL